MREHPSICASGASLLTALGLALLTGACGTDTDVAARSEAATCTGGVATTCAGGAAPVPDGDAPDRYDGVPTGRVDAGAPDAGALDAGSSVDASIGDAGIRRGWDAGDPFAANPCPQQPEVGPCSGLDGVLCFYSSGLVCGCFSELWWCAQNTRPPGSGPGGTRDDAGLEPIPCPPFQPQHGSACFAPALECNYGSRSCQCMDGAWRC